MYDKLVLPLDIPIVSDYVPVRLASSDLVLVHRWLADCLKETCPSLGWQDRIQAEVGSGSVTLRQYHASVTSLNELQKYQAAGCPRFSTDGNGRIYSTVTNMPSVARKYLSVGGESDLVSIDLSASQYFCLLPLGRALEVVPRHELHALLQDIHDDLYAAIAFEFYGIADHEHREVVKGDLMKAVFSRNEHNHRLRSVIERRYPAVAKMISGIKHGEHPVLAHTLQEIEANLVVRNLGYWCHVNSVPVVTVHDCLIVPRRYQQAVCAALVKVGHWYTGFFPAFKVKDLCGRFICDQSNWHSFNSDCAKGVRPSAI